MVLFLFPCCVRLPSNNGCARWRNVLSYRALDPYRALALTETHKLRTTTFSAENNPIGKEVNNMRYSKPEISELPNAVAAVQASESLTLIKNHAGQDDVSTTKMTVPAYIADE